jgi:hypothetical protein
MIDPKNLIAEVEMYQQRCLDYSKEIQELKQQVERLEKYEKWWKEFDEEWPGGLRECEAAWQNWKLRYEEQCTRNRFLEFEREKFYKMFMACAENVVLLDKDKWKGQV